jgi:Guanine nucleotide exchange factor synembryn
MDFCTTTRHYIFPNPVTLPSSAAKPCLAVTTNMSPADAPRGSLRYKCIRLLTWTESHTKRWMAELLWMLCDANAEEYTYRVGMGNAMPLLHARGLVELPTAAMLTVLSTSSSMHTMITCSF